MFISNEPRFRTLSTNNQSMYVGLPTRYDGIPTGMISYQGNSVGPNTSGSLTLTANFNEKTVSGKIYNRTQDNGATILALALQRFLRAKEDNLSYKNGLKIYRSFERYIFLVLQYNCFILKYKNPVV